MKVNVKIEFTNNKVKITTEGLFVVHFEEDGVHFMYAPAFDVTGYGKTKKEAEESFEISLDEFFEYTLEQDTLFTELEKLGWLVDVKNGQSALPPTFDDFLHKNKEFSDIVINKEFQKQRLNVAFA